MDVETALFVVSAALAAFWSTVIGVLHVRGWLPQAYTTRLAAIQASAATQIGLEVEGALNRVAEAQERKYQAAAQTTEAELAKQGKSLVMSGTRQIGIEKAQMKELQGLMVDGILGPAMQAIEAWNPDWAAKLREVPPDLLIKFLESPWFIANIKPRIQPYLDKFLGSQTESTSAVGNPFLKELGQ